MSKITIDDVLCKKCGLCTLLCPESIFVQENGSIPKLARTEACISCGHCVAACPTRAISHKDFPKGSAFFTEINANLALQNASLVSNALGLGSMYSGAIVRVAHVDKRISKLLSIPDNNQIYAALTLGYPKIKYRYWIERKTPRVRWV